MYEGVLPGQEIRRMGDDHSIVTLGEPRPPDRNIQPASLDLRLEGDAYRLRCSFLPMGMILRERIGDFLIERTSLSDGAVLETNRPYLVTLREELRLNPETRGRHNPRSSTGRLDVFTRLICERAHQFDSVPEGYDGRLYLEIIPRSFAIRIRSGMSLSQIRFIRGNARLDAVGLLAEHQRDPLALLDGEPLELAPEDLRRGLPLSVDLQGDDDGIVGYRARRNSRLLDLTSAEIHPREDFWEPLRAERGRRLVLEPEEFYILGSRESVRIPSHLAAEMVALDPRSGEFRAHYAGFFDPGFGYDSPGTRAVMEIRAHDVPFALEHGQRVCRLEFERLTEPARTTYGTASGSSYQGQGQGQGVQLSRIFE